MEIRALEPSDDRASFQSGDGALDDFFHKHALKNQHYIGTTAVAIDAGAVLGFATVAAGNLDGAVLPASLARKLPRYPLPCLRLARLAVAERRQRQGLGSELMRWVFQCALQMKDPFGCVGVVVDAKPEAVGFYLRFGFEPVHAVAGQIDERPRSVSMFLAIGELETAAKWDQRKRPLAGPSSTTGKP